MNWLEIPVFVHGVTPQERPGSHREDYESLLALVNEALERAGKPCFLQAPIGVEWGWDSGGAPDPDSFLAEAERIAGRKALDIEDASRDFTLIPLRGILRGVRETFLFGFADMFYYVSEEGETAVRDKVFRAVTEQACARAVGGEAISLTFFAHSAGSVVVHDLLYHLFGRPAGPKDTTPERVAALLALKKYGRFRVRRVFSFGSPITPLMYRSNALLRRIVEGRLLEPAALGLEPDAQLPGPRWVNYWDKDDAISYPLAFHYAQPAAGPIVADEYMDVGDVFPRAHWAYWKSADLARAAARVW